MSTDNVKENIVLYLNTENTEIQTRLIISPSSLPFDDKPTKNSLNLINSDTIYELSSNLTIKPGDGIKIDKTNNKISLTPLISKTTIGKINGNIINIPQITFDKFGRATAATENTFNISTEINTYINANVPYVMELLYRIITGVILLDNTIYSILDIRENNPKLSRNRLIPVNLQYYKKWSNGILEQGGLFYINKSATAMYINFWTPFFNNKYHFFRNSGNQAYDASIVNSYTGWYCVKNKRDLSRTTTSIRIRTGGFATTIVWYAIGFWENPTKCKNTKICKWDIQKNELTEPFSES